MPLLPAALHRPAPWAGAARTSTRPPPPALWYRPRRVTGGGRDVPIRVFLDFVSTAAGRRMLGRPGSPDLPSLWRPANERNFIEE